jgi:hypothetical protein
MNLGLKLRDFAPKIMPTLDQRPQLVAPYFESLDHGVRACIGVTTEV